MKTVNLTRDQIENDDTVVCEICFERPNVLPDIQLSPTAREMIDKSTTPKWGVFCENGHAFHWFCMAPLFKTEETAKCPQCRQPPVPDLRDTLQNLPERIANSLPERKSYTGIYDAVAEIQTVIQKLTTPADEGDDNSAVLVYEGEGDARRMVRFELPNGIIEYYEGERDEEHIVRTVFPDGRVWHYRGEMGEERLVRRYYPNGFFEHYRGDQGEERLVRRYYPNGRVLHYEGEQGMERVVRIEPPNTQI